MLVPNICALTSQQWATPLILSLWRIVHMHRDLPSLIMLQLCFLLCSTQAVLFLARRLRRHP